MVSRASALSATLGVHLLKHYLKSEKKMKNMKIMGVALVASVLAISPAFALIPPGVETAFTTAGTDASTVVGYAASALVLIIGATWVVRAITRQT